MVEEGFVVGHVVDGSCDGRREGNVCEGKTVGCVVGKAEGEIEG